MSVSRQVVYWDYWNFLIWGEGSAWGSLKNSSEVALIPEPADFDLEAMEQKVSGSDRVVVSEDKRCIVDGIFILNTPNRTSFLQIGSAVERAMKNIALGSALLATAMAVSHRVVAKYPYIRLIALIGSMAATCFTLLRYWQAHGRVRNEQNHLWGVGIQIAGWRKECYSLRESESSKMHKCLLPFEGEALFKRDFLKWAGPYSALRLQTPQEKEKWVEELLVKMESSRKKAQQLLDGSCVGSSTLKDTLGPVFGAWATFARAFDGREKELDDFKTAHRMYAEKIEKWMWASVTGIFQAQVSISTFKLRQCKTEDEKQNVENICNEYFQLACKAAFEGAPSEDFVKWVLLGTKVEPFCINSSYYDKASIFFGKTFEILHKGQGDMPELKVLSKIPPFPPKAVNVLEVQGEEAFLIRAKKLVPTLGTQEEYDKFLYEIFVPGHFKISF